MERETAGHAHDAAMALEGCPHCARIALSATLHCLTGCAIGEVLGLAIATAAGLANTPSIVLAVVLAFAFGYGLTMRPLVLGGLGLGAAFSVALAADTLSLVVMEIIDNAIMFAVPGAMEAGLADGLFWGSLAIALVAAFVAAFPVNYLLIRRGRATIHSSHR